MSQFSDTTKSRVRMRQNGCCALCGEHEDRLFFEDDTKVNFHHILPVNSQGPNGTFNCAMLCKDCHAWIHMNSHYRTPIVHHPSIFPYANMSASEIESFYNATANIMLDYIVVDCKAGSLSRSEAINKIKQEFQSDGFFAKAGWQVETAITRLNRELKGNSMPKRKFSMSGEMRAKGKSTAKSTSKRSGGGLPGFSPQLRQGAAIIADSDKMRHGAEDLKDYQRYLQSLCEYTEDLLHQARSSWQDEDYDTLYRAWRSVREKMEAFQDNLNRDIEHLENKAAQIDNLKRSS